MKFSNYESSTEKLNKAYTRRVNSGSPLLKILNYIGYKDPKLKKEVMKEFGITQKMLDDEE